MIQELVHQDRTMYSKGSLAHESSFGSSQEGEEDFQKKIFKKTCVIFVNVKILYFNWNVNDRLVVDCSSSYTHTQNLYVFS